MPRTEDYEYPHAYFTPEPHCVPGYTGYLPGFGPHKLYQYGQTYGQMTHDIMDCHPIAGTRLNPILSDKASTHWQNGGHSKHSTDTIPGYTGHVPRKNFFCGKGYQEECRKGIAEFEKLQADRRDDQCSGKYLPPEDILPRNIVFPKRLFERPHHRNVPSYATFTNPMNYGKSVFEMSDLDPRKTYMPGYTGYYTGKSFDVGVPHSTGAYQDLCDLSASRLERLVAERRPKVSDWFSCPKPHPPEPPEMAGYHPPKFEPVKPVPGYAGHVPGHRDSGFGASYGRSAGAILRERELADDTQTREP